MKYETDNSNRGQYESDTPKPQSQTTVNEGTGPRMPKENK